MVVCVGLRSIPLSRVAIIDATGNTIGRCKCHQHLSHGVIKVLGLDSRPAIPHDDAEDHFTKRRGSIPQAPRMTSTPSKPIPPATASPSTICRSARGVTDKQDHHIVATNAVTDDGGMHRDQLAHSGPRTRRPRCGSSPDFPQHRTEPRPWRGRLRIEIEDIIVGTPDPAQGGASPDNPHTL